MRRPGGPFGSSLGPEGVSSMLDRLYARFDDLSVAHGVFKVRVPGWTAFG